MSKSKLHRVNQTQTLLAGVAEPSEISSRITAGVRLDDGFPLELGVVGFDQEQTVGVLSARLWWPVVRLLQITDDPDQLFFLVGY